MSVVDVRATVVCEGVNDAEVIRRLAERENIGGVGLEHMKGDAGRLAKTLTTIASRSNFHGLPALAVVLDANGNPADALSMADKELRKIIPLGKSPLDPDRVRQIDWNGRAFRVGAFIMPGEGQNGALEELILQSARDDLMKCVRVFRECARDAGKGAAEKESKKSAQALLSALPKHCFNWADAAEKGMIDFNHGAFTGLKKFIRDLAP